MGLIAADDREIGLDGDERRFGINGNGIRRPAVKRADTAAAIARSNLEGVGTVAILRGKQLASTGVIGLPCLPRAIVETILDIIRRNRRARRGRSGPLDNECILRGQTRIKRHNKGMRIADRNRRLGLRA